MEAAPSYWKADDVIEEIVGEVVNSGREPIEVIDAMWPIHLRPECRDRVVREGLRSLVNGRGGMRSFRSGKVQSARSRIRPVAEESAGLEEFADAVLARLVFETADGRMAPVSEFGHEDATYQYGLRVARPRAQADREEPFWKAVVAETANGRTVGRRAKDVRRKLARLAVEARLTNGEDEE